MIVLRRTSRCDGYDGGDDVFPGKLGPSPYT